MALWTDSTAGADTGLHRLRASRYVTAMGWDAPVTLDELDANEVGFAASLALAPSGLGVAVWAGNLAFRAGDSVSAADFK